MRAKDIAILGGIGAALYLLTRANKGIDKGAEVIADWWVQITTEPVSLTAQIALPDGRVIPADAIVDSNWMVGNTLHFRYQGAHYKMTGARHGGTYQAVEA